jgi:zinc D-Ala-D-Ala carboxypeptidase
MENFDLKKLERKNFTAAEFYYSRKAEELKISNKPTTPEQFNNLMRTADKAQEVRDILMRPMIISRGFSCQEVNKKVGGKLNSQHLKGEAIDFECPEFGTPLQIVRFIKKSKIVVDQCIAEKRIINGKIVKWVHLSIVEDGKNRNQFLECTGDNYSFV